MRKSTGGFFSKLTSSSQQPKANRKNCGRPSVELLSGKLSLEKVLGLTTTNRNGLSCNPVTGVIAYPAGCVIVLYDSKSNLQNHIFSPDKKTITCVNFSSDGRYLASGESGQNPLVRVWELNETLTQVSELKGHKSGITSVEFSPNSKLLVSIGDQHDMLVNVWNWKLCQTVACNKSGCRVRGLSFSEDGKYIVTVGNRHVKFWYLDSESSLVKGNVPTIPINGRSGILGDQKNNVFTDVMCGRGKCSMYTFCITKSGLLCLFNEKRIMDKWVELEAGSTNCLVVTENLIFCGCSNGLIRVFEPATLRFIATLPRPHPLGVNVSDAISPSDLLSPSHVQTCPDLAALCIDDVQCKLTSVYNDHSIYIWDVHDVKKVGKVASFLYHSACIWGVEVYPYNEDTNESCLPSGSFLTCSADDTIRIWNLDKGGTCSKSYPRNLYSKELRKTIYVDAALANLQDTSMVPFNKDSDGKNGVRCMQISPNGQVVATGDRTGNLRIYEMQFFDELYRIEAHESEILCVEFSCPDSGYQLLASSSRDRLIHIFDAAKAYELLQTIDDHSSSITAVRFNYDLEMLQLLSCGADKVVMFHDAQVNENRQITFVRNTIVPGKATLYDMGVDPTRKFAATVGQDRNLRIYEIQGAKQLHCYKGSLSEEGNLIKFQLDGGGVYAAISCSDKTIGIYDFASGDCEATIYGHSELVTGLKFTVDGKNLISVSGDGCIFIWGLPDNFVENIRMRVKDLGLPLPADIKKVNTDIQKGDIRRQTFVVKPDISLLEDPSQRPAENGPRSSISGYRFSVGQLPVWAQKQLRPVNPGGPVHQSASTPLGRWGERKEGLTTVPEMLTTARMHSEESVLSTGSDLGDRSPVMQLGEDEFHSEVIYPLCSEDNQTTEYDRSFQVTESRRSRLQSNGSFDKNAIGNHVAVNGDYAVEENFSDSEHFSDCLSGSPDGSDLESDVAETTSPLMEHFERLGTPVDKSYSCSSIDNESTNVHHKMSRSMSISAKFLSKSQTKGNRKGTVASLYYTPAEQKRKLEALKAKFRIHANNKKPSKSKSADSKGMLFRQQKSIDTSYPEEQKRGSKLRKDTVHSRSCQNLSSVAYQDFDMNNKSPHLNSISNLSDYDHRKSSTPIYAKHGKIDNKQRKKSDLSSWGPTGLATGSPATRLKRSGSLQGDSLTRSDSQKSLQFPVKTSNKKLSPQTGRRRSNDNSPKNLPNGTYDVVMRKNPSRTPRTHSVLVDSVTKKEFEKQLLKDISHTDEESDNLFSKVKQALKQKHSPVSHQQKHSPPRASSQTKYSPPQMLSQNKHSPQSISRNKHSPPQAIAQNTRSPSHSFTTGKAPPHGSKEKKRTLPQAPTHEIDIDEMEVKMDTNYLVDQQAVRIERVANEINNVIHTQNNQSHSKSVDNDVLNMTHDGSYLNSNSSPNLMSSTPPERDVPTNMNMETTYDATNEETELEQTRPPDDPVSWDECQGIMNNLVNSYNEAAEFQTKVLEQPQSDVQKQLLSLISRTYLAIENSIHEQRKLIDKNVETNTRTLDVMESERFKELQCSVAKVISSPTNNKSKDDVVGLEMIALLDKYSNLLVDMVTNKKNKETLIE